MRTRPKKILPQSVRDKILCFLANCGMKTNLIVALLWTNAILGTIQIILLLSMLLR